MIRVVLTRLALIAASSMILGCGLPERPEVITISQPPTSRPAKPSDVKTVEEAMAAIMTVCREDLHLPIVDPIQLFLYKDTASFEAFGRSRTTNLIAYAHGHELHVNLEKTRGKRWGTSIVHVAMVEILAHEYGHVISNTVATMGRKTDYWPIWFEEGFAGGSPQRY